MLNTHANTEETSSLLCACMDWWSNVTFIESIIEHYIYSVSSIISRSSNASLNQDDIWENDNLFIYILVRVAYIPSFPLGATARSYRRQDGANAAARFEKFLPARASLRPPISLKFST